MQTVLLLSSAFLCFFSIFGLASFDTVTTLMLSRLASFFPFFEVIPEIFRIFAHKNTFNTHSMSKKTITEGQTNTLDIECQKTYDILFTRYYAKVRNFAHAIVKDENEAEDIAQDVFLKLWIQRDKIGFVDNWDSYLYSMTHNRTLNALKQKVRERNLRSYPETGIPEEDSLEETIFSEELKAILENVISKMPDQRRRIFTMSRLQGMTNQEIAQALHISKRTVETHISAALAQVRRVVTMALVFHFLVS